MTRTEAVTAFLAKSPEQKKLYSAARIARKGASITLPERLTPIVLLALENFYDAYSYGAEAMQDHAEAKGMMMAGLTPRQADAVAAIMGNVADFRTEYKEAHE